MKVYIPEGYKSILGMYDTQKAISLIHRLFEDRLGALLNLYRVSAPLFVEENSGLNDNLNGYERPVSFDILHAPDHKAQVVQSLAKWKRLALKRYGFFPGKGLYTDMNAIRRDEDELDNLHSVYVDQWDWEKVILPENRNTDYLKLTVMDIVSAICDTQDTIESIYPQLQVLGKLKRDVSFVTTQELEDLYPDLTPKQRENTWVKEHRTAFIMGIGGKLRSGQRHDGRSGLRHGDLFHGNPRGSGVDGPPAASCRLRRAQSTPVSQNASERRASPDHRRRHRSVPRIHAPSGKGPHRRGASVDLGRSDRKALRRTRRSAALSG